MQNNTCRLVVFEDKKIRRIFHNGEWYFSIIDIIDVLTDSSNPRCYWSGIKSQLSESEVFIPNWPCFYNSHTG